MAMIQANDLRIGNILQSYEGSEFEYVVIQSGDILMCQEANENFNNWRKPIPITEEWLLKLGFEKLPHSFTCDIFHLTEWDDYPLNWCVAMNKNNAVIVLKLKYIHQLQNLYHALTGEELTIKP